MVSDPSPTAAVTPAGRLIERTFSLWTRSWKQTFVFSLVYGIATLLPGFALQGVLGTTLMGATSLLANDAMQDLPIPMPLPAFEVDPRTLLDPLIARLHEPSFWLLLLLSAVGVVASTTALIVRQYRIDQGIDTTLGEATRIGLARTPATFGAWVVYSAIVFVTALPFLLLTAWGFSLAMTGDVALLMLAMMLVLVGGLVSSIPLVWASIAFGFAPFASAMYDDGPLASQVHSRRRVRGQFWRCAAVVSMPLLIYFGAGGMVSSLVLFACGAAVVALHGWGGLMAPGWLLWSQVISVPLQAMLLPLAFAGGVVMLRELQPSRLNPEPDSAS